MRRTEQYQYHCTMKQEQEGWANCVQVKGMNALSCAYIKRFFGHAGPVQDVRKDEESVIVRFKHHGSLSKAQRYSGRVIDKQPLKIRNVVSLPNPHDNSETSIPRPFSKAALRFDQDKYHQKIKYGPLDIPFHWAQSLKVVDLLPDCRARWLMHEIMLLQMTHALHHASFGTCPRATHTELRLKEMLINNNSLKEKVETEKQNLQKLELSIPIPNDNAYQASFQINESDTEKKLRFMLKYYFKQFGIGNRALHLYIIFYRNALKPEDHCVILSESKEPEDKKEYRRIQIESRDQQQLQLSVQEWSRERQRSQYRNVDEEHPSRAIEIFSDSCFHKNPYTRTIYSIFREDFDGTMENTCAGDIFHRLRPYFAPNYLLLRHISGDRTLYVRLDFQLRMVNSRGEKFESNEYSKTYLYQQSKDFQTQGFTLVEQVSLLQHNLVLPALLNPHKFLYLVKNYARYYCLFDKPDSSESQQSFEAAQLAVFAVLKNPNSQKMEKVAAIYKSLIESEEMKKLKFSMFLVCIDNTQKFEELKCRNYIETYIDQLNCELTDDIAKFYAKQLLDRSPEKFKEILDADNFVQRTLWGLYLQKSKRKAKNQVMNSLRNARSNS